MAAFSRVQLAAALLEYDNDLQNPAAPYRSAHESAIFLPLRRNATAQPQPMGRRSTDYLGVSLPSEGGSVSGRESALSKSHKKSGSSIHALRNPFGGDGAAEEEDDPEKEGLNVDLTSWGLDAFLPEDKAKAKSDSLPNPHPRPVIGLRQGSGEVIEPERRRPERPGMGGRSRSMGNFDFGEGGAFLDAQSSSPRPKSVADPLDMSDFQPPQAPFQRRRASSHALIEGLASKAPLHTVPFPTSDSRSGSPLPYDNEKPPSRPISRGSGYLLDDQQPSHRRTNSGSSRKLLDEDENMFAVRPPSPERASRFDPKSIHARTHSNATMATMATRNLLVDEENIFAIRPPSPSRSSRFDPKMAAHARTMSNASLGSRMLLDNDGVSMLGGASMMSGRPMTTRDRPFSNIDLLRPKVLVMPSPLQGTNIPEPQKVREGFRLSTSGPPLPPGARTSRPTSGAYDQSPVASHLFTPNPRMNLSLAQLAFRNTLLVDGERDVAYSDIDRVLPRATEDGEQMQMLDEEVEVNDDYGAQEQPGPVFADEPIQPGRPAGKLFGKSLIDDLESRKLNMRNKQRVFRGDDRPSMMNRGLQRSGTFIDPESLQRPVSGAFQPQAAPTRQNSAKAGPLLTFDDNLPGNRTTLSPNPGVQNSRSVFGTDTLWEREMKKLKQMEAEEKAAKEREETEGAQSADKKKRSKGKRKGKGKEKEIEQVTTPMTEESEEPPSRLNSFIEPLPRVSAEPPVLPAIEKPIVRGPPPPANDYDTESDSDASIKPAKRQARRGSAETAAARWVAGSSDEDEGPVRTTGVGLRNRKQSLSKARPRADDSDEDIPLSVSMGRALQRAMPTADDSDEDRPLSTMLDKSKMGIPPINFDKLSLGKGREDGDDDQPLGLRASRMLPSQGPTSSYAGGDDDDDKPLALHPDQQRRTQYQAMAQQQQMMMQAQMQQSMFFGPPSMMSSGFFGPPMAPMAPVPSPMMMGPMISPQQMSPPSVGNDSAKYGRVDRWRHDVAVEGQPSS